MKNNLTRSCVAAAVLSALGAGPALAQEDGRGFSLGAGLGQFNIDLDEFDDVDDVISDLDSDDLSWKIFGAYRFNPYFSVEAAYVNFGEPGDDFSTAGTSGDYSISLSGFAPYVVGTLPLGRAELFAKLGYYFYDVDVDIDLDNGETFQSDDSGEDVVWGLGIGTTIMEKLNLRLEYEIVDVQGADDANAYWLTAAWRF